MKDEDYGFWAMLELYPFKGSLTPKGRRVYQREYLRRVRFFVSLDSHKKEILRALRSCSWTLATKRPLRDFQRPPSDDVCFVVRCSPSEKKGQWSGLPHLGRIKGRIILPIDGKTGRLFVPSHRGYAKKTFIPYQL